MRQKMLEKRKALEKSKTVTASAAAENGGGGDDHDDAVDFEPEEEEEEKEEEEGKEGAEGEGGTGWGAGDADDETDKEKGRRKAIKARAKEYESLREEMKAKHRAARVMTGQERATYDAVSSDNTTGMINSNGCSTNSIGNSMACSPEESVKQVACILIATKKLYCDHVCEPLSTLASLPSWSVLFLQAACGGVYSIIP